MVARIPKTIPVAALPLALPSTPARMLDKFIVSLMPAAGKIFAALPNWLPERVIVAAKFRPNVFALAANSLTLWARLQDWICRRRPSGCGIVPHPAKGG